RFWVSNEQMTDEELVERIRAGEHELFSILMERHRRRMYRAIRGIVRRESETEDALQQTYLNAYAHLHQFAGRSKFSTWLLRIAVHEALDRARGENEFERGVVVSAAGQHVLEIEDSGPDPERAAFGRELQRLIETEILKLDPLYRAVFMLREVEGLNTAETAECLNVSIAVVRTRLLRARAMLRERLLKHAGVSMGSLFNLLGP
ncbi:MAG TPA: RNA polymerase sigma factor, partial [Thermoanaerobaculia bacterium]|nr:RNA polymerase sigma factor [Thermoanaerobaculia bacterium]